MHCKFIWLSRVLKTFPFLALAACGRPATGARLDAVDGRMPIGIDARYHAFASPTDALTWATGFEAKYTPAIRPRPLRPLNDPIYGSAQQVVDRVWGAFERLHPGVIAGLPAPQAVVIEDAAANAYAVYDPDLKQIPLAFFLHSGILQSNAQGKALNEDQLYFLVAHELAHMVMAHVYPGVSKTRAIHYRVRSGQEELGYLQADDPELATPLQIYNDAAEWVGEETLPELNGLPIWLSDNQLTKLWSRELSDLLKVPAPAVPAASCLTMKDIFKTKMTPFLATNYDFFANSLRVEGSMRVDLDAMTRSFIASGTECFASGRRFRDALKSFFHVTEVQLQSLAKEDPVVYAELDNPNTFAAMIKITLGKFAVMAPVAAKIDLPHVRIRTFEEEADDYGMLVNHLLKKNAKDGPQDFFLNILSSADDHARCKLLLDRGEVPPYGSITEPHHGTCYRVFHVRQFNELVFGD